MLVGLEQVWQRIERGRGEARSDVVDFEKLVEQYPELGAPLRACVPHALGARLRQPREIDLVASHLQRLLAISEADILVDLLHGHLQATSIAASVVTRVVERLLDLADEGQTSSPDHAQCWEQISSRIREFEGGGLGRIPTTSIDDVIHSVLQHVARRGRPIAANQPRKLIAQFFRSYLRLRKPFLLLPSEALQLITLLDQSRAFADYDKVRDLPGVIDLLARLVAYGTPITEAVNALAPPDDLRHEDVLTAIRAKAAGFGGSGSSGERQ